MARLPARPRPHLAPPRRGAAAEHDLSFAEYDALLTIARGARPPDPDGPAGRRVILSKSGVTRLIDRLVADGLVERSACLSDARGAEAVLTEAGLDRLRAASRTHLRGISEHFLAVVDPDDLEALDGTSLGCVAAGRCPAATQADPRGLREPAEADATPR